MEENLLRDRFAVVAPAVPDSFVPTLIDPRPTAVLSPNDYIIANYSPSAIAPGTPTQTKVVFDNYYDQVNKIWNDEKYAQEHAGETEAPVGIKNIVAVQQYLYDAYLVTDAAWLAEYAEQKLYQWPYYYADKVIQHRS